MTLLVTLDTNVLDLSLVEVLESNFGHVCEFAVVTVVERERGAGRDSFVTGARKGHLGGTAWSPAVPEAIVLDESPLGSGVLAAEDDEILFESALEIISHGSFPRVGYRDCLDAGSVRQLRDAMVFEAHVRRRRHVLVTGDRKGFISGGRREQLEILGRTLVRTPEEFPVLLSELGLCGAEASKG
jgi:hypothetical protein